MLNQTVHRVVSRRAFTCTMMLLALLLSVHVAVARQTRQAVQAFGRYIAATEERFLTEVASPPGSFLHVDLLPPTRRARAVNDLHQGKLFIEKLQTRDANGQKIKVPDASIDHWIGIVFIPGVSLDETLALMQDYDRHAEIYGCMLEEARILAQQDDCFQVFYRTYQRKLGRTYTFDTEHDVGYFRLAPDRAYSISRSTTIQQVKNAGKPSQQVMPAGSGPIWRLNSYAKYLQRDGGTYVEIESVSLRSKIPLLLRWLLGRLVSRLPKGILTCFLESTRQALLVVSNAPTRDALSVRRPLGGATSNGWTRGRGFQEGDCR